MSEDLTLSKIIGYSAQEIRFILFTKFGNFHQMRDFFEENGYQSYYFDHIDNADNLRLLEDLFKNQILQNDIKELLNKALKNSYNDILDHIVENYNFEEFFIKPHEITNSYGIRKILNRFPNFLENVPNWSLKSNFDSALEIRFYGFAKKLNPLFLIKFYKEFLKDCVGEIDAVGFLNQDKRIGLRRDDIALLLKIYEIIPDKFNVNPEYLEFLINRKYPHDYLLS